MSFESKDLLLNFTLIRFESDKSQGKMLWDYFTLLYYYGVKIFNFLGINEHLVYYVLHML